MENTITQLEHFKQKTLSGNFSKDDWIEFNLWAKECHNHVLSNKDPHYSIDLFRNKLANFFPLDSIPGHILHKPLGYAGDFQLIEKFYNFTVSNDTRYKIWDEFIQFEPAAVAVRNRVDYFNCLLNEKQNNAYSNIFSLGCGSCNEIYNFLINSENTKSKTLNFTCLDIEEKALKIAKERLKDFYNIFFIKGNAFRFQTLKKFDLIWSAGLFDYFNDVLFSKMIKKYFDLLKPNGELVIGNFSYENTTKYAMDIFGWQLYHRTPVELLKFVTTLNISNCYAAVDCEEKGINLFLRIKKSEFE